MILFTMLLIPTIVALGFFLFTNKKITIGEFFLQNGIQVVIMSLFLLIDGCGSTSDTEIQNGRVTKKERTQVSCSHSYQCNCYQLCSGSGQNQTCHQACSTCHEHSYDVDWDVYTSNNENIEIDRINRQGTQEPPRWTAIKIGEPTAITHHYTNYIKASPDSLFRKQGLVEKYKTHIPKYPEVYDYYRVNRTVLVNGASVKDLNEWNNILNEMNADLGYKKQVNINIVAVKDLSNEYFSALEQAWIGSKKNDFTLVVGIDSDGNINWAEVMAWTNNKMAEVVAKDFALSAKNINNINEISFGISSAIDMYYKRKPMKDFEYLKNSTTPTLTTWIFAMITGLISSIGLGILFMNNGYLKIENL